MTIRCACLAAGVGALFFTIPVAHTQTGADQAILEALALLFHGSYGEQPYQLTYTSSGTATVEETGGRSLRFVVRPVAGTSCVFLATFETPSGLNIEQLDFTKFDGSHQIIDTCGEKGTPLEKSCYAGLRFGQQPSSFCQYVFDAGDVSLQNLSFPEGACRRYFAYGARRRSELPKYVTAFDTAYMRCVASTAHEAKPPESRLDK